MIITMKKFLCTANFYRNSMSRQLIQKTSRKLITDCNWIQSSYCSSDCKGDCPNRGFQDESNSKGTQTIDNDGVITDKSAPTTKSILKSCGWFALKTTVISGAVIGGIAVAVPAVGFTAGGVAAGSLAAAYQSAVLGGTIASGSAFAVLQSVGAAGLAASTNAGIVAGSAAVAGTHTLVKKILRKDKK